MDGRDHTESMSGLFATLRSRDPVQLALQIARTLQDLEPCDVPILPLRSVELGELLDARTPGTVPEHLRQEYAAWSDAVLARSNAKGENVRRLRGGLWAEQCLRGRPDCQYEHARLVTFHREIWGLSEPAAADAAEREAQVKAHA